MKKATLLLIICTIFLCGNVNAQSFIYMPFGIEGGSLVNNFNSSTSSSKQMLSQVVGLHYNANIGIGTRFGKYIGLEGQAGFGSQYTNLRDSDFENRHPEFKARLKFINPHLSTSASLWLGLPLNNLGLSAYLKTTYELQYSKKESFQQVIAFEQVKQGIQENLQADVQYQSINRLMGFELGLDKQASDVAGFRFGIKSTFATGGNIEAVYTVSDPNSQAQNTQSFNIMGNYLSFNFAYIRTLKRFEKRERKPKQPKGQEPAIDIEKREINITKTMEVESPTVTIKIWDHRSEDGDRVLVTLNGQTIIDDLAIKKKGHTFEVNLVEGKNLFSLHALNLGRSPPNTAALRIKAGERTETLIMSSDMSKSGTIELIYRPK